MDPHAQPEGGQREDQGTLPVGFGGATGRPAESYTTVDAPRRVYIQHPHSCVHTNGGASTLERAEKVRHHSTRRRHVQMTARSRCLVIPLRGGGGLFLLIT